MPRPGAPRRRASVRALGSAGLGACASDSRDPPSWGRSWGASGLALRCNHLAALGPRGCLGPAELPPKALVSADHTER